jgi:hypothetical protein
MQFFNNQIFIGAGDVGDNAGPVPVWTINSQDSLKQIVSLNEEEISLFNVQDSSLLIPGIDPIGNPGHGNAYIYSNGQISKTFKIPDAIHIFDFVEYKSHYFVIRNYESELLRSIDAGKTWSVVSNPYPYYPYITRIVPAANTLYLLGDISQGYCQYVNDSITFTPSNLAPGKMFPGYCAPERICNYKNGFAYTCFGLFYFDCTTKTARRFPFFASADEQVKDIISRDDTLYVMTTETFSVKWPCTIYTTVDLVNWKIIYRCEMPAMPKSMELMNNAVYIGLGNPERHSSMDFASGNIYKITR